MNFKRKLLDKVNGGRTAKPVVGAWCISSSPMILEILSATGLDFLIADFEHGAWSVPVLDHAVSSLKLSKTALIVRPSNVDQVITQAAFDLGASGVIYPQITDAKVAKSAINLSRFAPNGALGFNPFTRRFGFGSESNLRADEDFCRTVIIENNQSWQQLDEILEIETLDAVYLGVYDMSVALGVPGQTNHPIVLEFVRDVAKRTKQAGKAVGMMAKNVEQAALAREVDADMVLCGLDTEIIFSATSQRLNEVLG